jgi:hypothetical protein
MEVFWLRDLLAPSTAVRVMDVTWGLLRRRPSASATHRDNQSNLASCPFALVGTPCGCTPTIVISHFMRELMLDPLNPIPKHLVEYCPRHRAKAVAGHFIAGIPHAGGAQRSRYSLTSAE